MTNQNGRPSRQPRELVACHHQLSSGIESTMFCRWTSDQLMSSQRLVLILSERVGYIYIIYIIYIITIFIYIYYISTNHIVTIVIQAISADFPSHRSYLKSSAYVIGGLFTSTTTKDTHTQSVFKVAHPCLEFIFINWFTNFIAYHSCLVTAI